MDKVDEYLRIPAAYGLTLGGLRWSADGEAIEFADGSTFAFAGEVVSFLEGFSLQGPFPHFGLVLHLLHLLRHDRSSNEHGRLPALQRAFRQAGQVHRNAGALCALLCRHLPAAPAPPSSWQIWRRVILRSFSTSPEFLARRNPGEEPPLAPEEFFRQISHALGHYDHDDLVHWLRYGRGPVKEAAERIAEAIDVERPRTLQGVLAELARQERLSGAVPFVAQLVSALALPLRRLDQHELPLGGYSDVTTRGQPEQILPAQFALDDLEFVRRHAERELLYYRREEPHAQTREELVLLLDQGVRTWGVVRLVLAAALFAFGQLADRRRLPFRVAATSDGGVPHDPLEIEDAALAALMQASDLSPHPALALERLLEDDAAGARDVVLLTHPFSLAEPDVVAAARRLRPDSRLFAVTVDARGQVQVSEVRRGAPLTLNRFHVDLEPPAPPPPKRPAEPAPTAWTGDVEPVGFPFRFGAANDPGTGEERSMRFSFDHAGDWLLLVTRGGMAHAVRTDGTGSEVLPRGMKDGQLIQATDVIGVASGFVVLGHSGASLFAMHYDFSRRHGTAYLVRTGTDDALFYFRPLHSVVIGMRNVQTAIDLASGQRVTSEDRSDTLSRAGRALLLARDRVVKQPFLKVGRRTAQGPEDGYASLDPGSGEVMVDLPHQAPVRFTPQSDGKLALRGHYLHLAQARHNTLVLAVVPLGIQQTNRHIRLCLYQLPGGATLSEYKRGALHVVFMLSSYGRHLAREISPFQVEICPCGDTGRRTIQTPVGGFHSDVSAQLGDCWLTIQIGTHTTHLLHWRHGQLVHSCDVRGKSGGAPPGETGLSALSATWVQTRSTLLPSVVAYDPERFVRGARRVNNLDLVVDRFGQVFLFNPEGDLVCCFFALGQRLAAWAPEGTGFGAEELLGRRASPEAARLIGQRLLASVIPAR
jgi:hypothetical protein